jgi:alpha-1,6-mannosyltransferase
MNEAALASAKTGTSISLMREGVLRAGRYVGLLLLGAGLTVLTAKAPTLYHQLDDWALIVLFAVCGLSAYTASRLDPRRAERSALVIILCAAAAMRLALLVADPYLSSDIYRYIWDGRVTAAGINPYRFVPNAPELQPLRDAAIWPHINRADTAVTIYPPAAQGFFLGVTRFGESVLTMKIGLLLVEAIAIAALLFHLKRQAMPLTRIAAYAWHPLPIVEIAGNGHIDALMSTLLILGLLVYFNGRTLLAAVIVTLGALVKPTALLALPVFWRPWNWRLPLAVAATILIAYLPFLSVGWGALGFLPGYIQEEGLASGDGFRLLWLLQSVTGPLPHAAPIYLAVSAVALAALSVAIGFRHNRLEQAAIRSLSWLLIAFLILSSPHYTWYFLVLVPFLALSSSATAWVLTTGSVLIYGGLPSYDAGISLFTAATLAALAFDVWREFKSPMPSNVAATA